MRRSLLTVFYKLKTVNKFKDFIQYTKITLESGKKSLQKVHMNTEMGQDMSTECSDSATNHIKLLVLLLNLRERFDGRKMSFKAAGTLAIWGRICYFLDQFNNIKLFIR